MKKQDIIVGRHYMVSAMRNPTMYDVRRARITRIYQKEKGFVARKFWHVDVVFIRPDGSDFDFPVFATFTLRDVHWTWEEHQERQKQERAALEAHQAQQSAYEAAWDAEPLYARAATYFNIPDVTALRTHNGSVDVTITRNRLLSLAVALDQANMLPKKNPNAPQEG